MFFQTLPSSIDDECLSAKPHVDGVQSSDRHSQVEFWVQTLKLYAIQEKVLTTMYFKDKVSAGVKISMAPRQQLELIDFNSISKINSSLRDWEKALPLFLKVRKDFSVPTAEPIFDRQANVLHLRYEYLPIHLRVCSLIDLLADSCRYESSCSGLCFP
jgi:hypothetical protein